MEAIKNQISRLTKNTGQPDEPTRTFSAPPPIFTAIIPREQHAAIFSLINLYRAWLKWGMQTAEELDLEIRIWAEAFNEYGIPVDQYLPLLKRARELRIVRLSNGLDCPNYNLELLIACWIGENGLAAELERERIAAGRFLPATAESDCPRCYGKGREFVWDEQTSRILGVKPRCDHRPLVEGEYLWRRIGAKKLLKNYE